VMRVASFAMVVVLAALAGCTKSPQPETGTPAFYHRLDQQGATFNPQAMAGLINAWRMKNGLRGLTLDPALGEEAMRSARRDADQDRSVHGTMPVLARADAGGQIARPSAGYRTAAEAFSGWRDSPNLNAAMLDPNATRLGLGAAHKAGSKYGVYWVLIVAR
jgi:uncharacterized protein YkwD